MADFFSYGKPQFFTDDGDTLSSGTLSIYVEKTSNLATVYSDSADTVLINPVTLDSAGRAEVWLGSSSFKAVLKDADGNLIYSVPKVYGAQSSSLSQDGSVFAVTDTGSANTITGNLSPAISAYTAGLTVNIKVAADNTGATTINLNGLGAKTVKIGTTALAGGELTAGNWFRFFYDGSFFQLCAFNELYPEFFRTNKSANQTVSKYVTTSISNWGANTIDVGSLFSLDADNTNFTVARDAVVQADVSIYGPAVWQYINTASYSILCNGNVVALSTFSNNSSNQDYVDPSITSAVFQASAGEKIRVTIYAEGSVAQFTCWASDTRICLSAVKWSNQ